MQEGGYQYPDPRLVNASIPYGRWDQYPNYNPLGMPAYMGPWNPSIPTPLNNHNNSLEVQTATDPAALTTRRRTSTLTIGREDVSSVPVRPAHTNTLHPLAPRPVQSQVPTALLPPFTRVPTLPMSPILRSQPDIPYPAGPSQAPQQGSDHEGDSDGERPPRVYPRTPRNTGLPAPRGIRPSTSPEWEDYSAGVPEKVRSTKNGRILVGTREARAEAIAAIKDEDVEAAVNRISSARQDQIYRDQVACNNLHRAKLQGPNHTNRRLLHAPAPACASG